MVVVVVVVAAAAAAAAAELEHTVVVGQKVEKKTLVVSL